MPLETQYRREKFCLLVAQGCPQGRAASQAGYKHGSVAAAGLMKQQVIKDRITALRGTIDLVKAQEIVREQAPTREYVLSELMHNVQMSKQVGDRSNVNKGLELVGKEIGMFVTRSMQIESPLQRLPADRLILLLRLVDQVVGDDVMVAKAAPDAVVPMPVLEAEAEAEAEAEETQPWW